MQTFRVTYRDYVDFLNPPILHRKEMFVSSDDERWARFAALTRDEEGLGLYDDPPVIGTLQGWRDLLRQKGLRIEDHRVLTDAN